MSKRSHVLGIVLAGGEGKRLMPLTADRAKPAVPFGGSYRLIDFVLSNLVNGEIDRICVLTQYKSHSLDRHISVTWRMSTILGQYVTPVPAQQRLGPRWYQGSADAIHQSVNLIHDERPDHVIVFGADHVYRMDPRQMLEAHIASGMDATVAGIRVPREGASAFGIIHTSDGHKIDAFLEKPADPPGLPDDPKSCFASMGNYVFTADALIEALRVDADDPSSSHDMGGNIIPMMVAKGAAAVYDFAGNDVPGSTDRDRGYWRDVGTLDAYHESHMDLVSVVPIFNLYNDEWPILTSHPQLPGAKFVEGGHARESIVAPGSILSGCLVDHSVLSPGTFIMEGAAVSRAVVLDRVRVGARATIRDAILDKDVVVRDGATVGVDKEADRARGFTVTAGGITAVGKGTVVE
ncbi:glucose-1-phosphate adenylyltransferase [Phytoactinopolyspora halotolerans]|uniref:Glucose-1-phosphate adenylyltransferase n=1 Tax=Phytoactinopolyspora halotolerans TaxID=1981512 RepID=A0A6L9S701_9ACTN|nr:glucose-1-phosphate adenylyltransferase [Phytoactinopolyspora halotolerans]NEE00541.1 glucose-1-phosphate adenylyltransferase [Phytoactinopolyspora halotolerans]